MSRVVCIILYNYWRSVVKIMDEYDLEWTLPYLDNYTGPSWSDGKLQASVPFGKKKPRSKTDHLSREHDTGYALCSNDACLDSADRLYYDSTRSMSLLPRLLGDAVYYGNLPRRLVGSRRKLNKNMTKYGDFMTDYYQNGSGYTIEQYYALRHGVPPELEVEPVKPGNFRGSETGTYNPDQSGNDDNFVKAKPGYIRSGDSSTCYAPQLADAPVGIAKSVDGGYDVLGPNPDSLMRFLRRPPGRRQKGKKNKIYIM